MYYFSKNIHHRGHKFFELESSRHMTFKIRPAVIFKGMCIKRFWALNFEHFCVHAHEINFKSRMFHTISCQMSMAGKTTIVQEPLLFSFVYVIVYKLTMLMRKKDELQY